MSRPDATRLSCAGVVAAIALVVTPARATTFVALTFQQLIAQADVIFIGDVVDVRPYTQRTRTGTLVKTRVTFRVDDALYGTNSLVEVFDFLGGQADGIGMAVEGMPKFAVGDRRVVFARRGASINPIVGFTQGLLRVGRDTSGVERLSESTAITLTDLRSRIVSALTESGKR
jgi:hypothetical protein